MLDNSKMMLLAVPILLLQVGLWIAAIINLVKREKKEVIFRNKWIWAIIIILGEIFGPIIYFIAHSVVKGSEE